MKHIHQGMVLITMDHAMVMFYSWPTTGVLEIKKQTACYNTIERWHTTVDQSIQIKHTILQFRVSYFYDFVAKHEHLASFNKTIAG
jgi:hypothetical protein